MQIGYMLNIKKPNRTTRLLAKTCKYYNIELVFFNEHDVDLEKEIITGQVLNNNRWKKIELKTPPPYIDIAPYFFKFKELISFLKEKSQLSIPDRPGSKTSIFSKIKEDGDYADLLIPYKKYRGYNDVLEMIDEHGKVILKPIFGSKGNNVYQVSKKRRKFVVNHLNETKKYSKRKFKQLLSSKFKKDRTIIQKYIISRTNKDEPFDCRVRLEKNGKGEWKTAIFLVRIGSNNKIVSNVKRGGSVSKLSSFLKGNFPDNAEEIETNIKNIARQFPPKLEEMLDQNLVGLGLDLGIDQTGKPYLFEVESAPGYEFGAAEVITLKVDYYNYIKKKLKNKK